MENAELIKRLQSASDVLSEVGELAIGLPEHGKDAAAMALHVQLVQTYLSELALNLSRGEDVYDAVLTTARGLTPL